MGLFNEVNVEVLCGQCGSLVTGFQSKSGLTTLDLVDPTEVDNFYSSCGECGHWVEFSLPSPESSNHPQARSTPFNEKEIRSLGFELVDKNV